MVDKDGVFRLNTCFGPWKRTQPNGIQGDCQLEIRDVVVTLNEKTVSGDSVESRRRLCTM
ncbi:hypothetical protein [Leptospira noguchii]|uniref:hypothetical protein n=1 Tax=Leptospira noguchii TaxID=28182 RepID=UPI001FB7DA8A|nr:hypothetical protein [Leptospira noguchii]UOG36316.1 hypothetical protein MAL02_19410 [Leptospira noguchii]